MSTDLKCKSRNFLHVDSKRLFDELPKSKDGMVRIVDHTSEGEQYEVVIRRIK